MGKPNRRRTTTLSISLSPELAEAIERRIESGLYSSASELLREALRLLLRTEEMHEARVSRLVQDRHEHTPAGRFAASMELFDLGVAIRSEKLRRDAPVLSDEEIADRLRALDTLRETGPGLRSSPERLARLKLREQV